VKVGWLRSDWLGLAALGVGFQNAQQALPVMNDRLPRPPEVFQGLFVGGFGAQSPEGIAGGGAGADDFPHESVEHLRGGAAELFFERLDTRVLLGHSFTHDITSLAGFKLRLIGLSRRRLEKVPENFRFSPLLVVAAVALEIQDALTDWPHLPRTPLPIGELITVSPCIQVLVTGVGAVRAAAATALALQNWPCAALLHVGVGGAYPASGLPVGALVTAASECDPQAGILTPDGYRDLGGLGFPLTTAFPNRIVFDSPWADWVAQQVAPAPRLPFATVQCCSGTNAAAELMAFRAEAAVENMEGLAVAWTAGRFGVPYAALRAISNLTGDRDRQQWNLPVAQAVLAQAVGAILAAVRVESGRDCS
jgi:futalosine hydrolase